MEVPECHYNVPLSGDLRDDDRIASLEGRKFSKSADCRGPRQRRRRGKANVKIDDFEQATEFLQHFHAFTSRSLDVIYESKGHEEEINSSDYYFSTGLAQKNHHTSSSPNLLRTQTCSSLRDVQITPNMQIYSSDLYQDEDADEDDEWGFYFEDSESPDALSMTKDSSSSTARVWLTSIHPCRAK